MIRIFRADDVEFKGYHRGNKVIDFSKDLSRLPPEFKDKSFVELLTENQGNRYSLKQIKFDEEAGIYYAKRFAVNYGATRVDSLPLARGFIPEGDEHFERHTLYEVMPRKKEIHVIPNPARRLFYEEGKVSPRDIFYFDGTLEHTLEQVLEEFKFSRFRILEFAPQFDSLINPENDKRYFREKGFEYIKEGLPPNMAILRE